jgi:hypothetical protein
MGYQPKTKGVTPSGLGTAEGNPAVKRRKLVSKVRPPSVATDSGWNCTPKMAESGVEAP